VDLNTVNEVVVPVRRADLPPWRQGDGIIAGGTWLFSEPQTDLRRLVDVTALGWPSVTIQEHGLELAATCTVEQISALSLTLPVDWTAAPLFHQCATALVASFKVWKAATMGGNLALSFPAGAMISLVSGLDGTVLVWRPDGGEYRLGIADFVTGAATNAMADGELIRSVFLPASALRGRTAFRKIALSRLGRSGAVVIGRRDHARDGGAFSLAVTGSTTKPVCMTFPAVPSAGQLAAALAEIPDELWHSDAHGAPDWRRAVSSVLGQEIRDELE
jgi:CO/xanthine dehydrogenase FAD-binding subunit